MDIKTVKNSLKKERAERIKKEIIVEREAERIRKRTGIYPLDEPV